MNRKVMAIAGVLVLLLGGGGAYFFLMPGGAKAKKAEAAGKEAAAPPQPAPIFVNLEPINVPLWEGGRVAGFYLVAVKLQVPSQQARARIETMMPILRDAFLCGVSGTPGLRPRNDPDMLDFAALKSHLLALANSVLGKGLVDRVLIVHAMRTMG